MDVKAIYCHLYPALVWELLLLILDSPQSFSPQMINPAHFYFLNMCRKYW